jgi:deoxyribonuclease-4
MSVSEIPTIQDLSTPARTVRIGFIRPDSRERDRNRGWHPHLGAHWSIAGGLHLALEEAARHRAGAVQIFSKTSGQWAAKPLTSEAIRQFHETRARLGPFETAVHDSYLINLGSPDPVLLEKSFRAFVHEIERCETLGIPRLVFHPGSHLGEGEAACLKRIASSMKKALRATRGFATRLLIENTAGQGSNVGYRLEHLEELLVRVGDPDRVRVCIDTCHLLAAGYDYRTEQGYADVRGELEQRVGLDRIDWFHLNDSKKECGSRVDRHEHIGKGFVGAAAIGRILRDPAFREVPAVLETPKIGQADRRNLALLRRLSRIPLPSGKQLQPDPRVCVDGSRTDPSLGESVKQDPGISVVGIGERIDPLPPEDALQ